MTDVNIYIVQHDLLHAYWEMLTTIKLMYSSPHIVTILFVCLCVVRTLQTYSQQISSIQCSIINYRPHAVHSISRPYSFYNWKFVPLDQHLPILWFNEFDFLRFYTWVRSEGICPSVFGFISIIIRSSKFIHVIANGRKSLFLQLNTIPLCIYEPHFLHLFIHL